MTNYGPNAASGSHEWFVGHWLFKWLAVGVPAQVCVCSLLVTVPVEDYSPEWQQSSPIPSSYLHFPGRRICKCIYTKGLATQDLMYSTALALFQPRMYLNCSHKSIPSREETVPIAVSRLALPTRVFHLRGQEISLQSDWVLSSSHWISKSPLRVPPSSLSREDHRANTRPLSTERNLSYMIASIVKTVGWGGLTHRCPLQQPCPIDLWAAF